MEPKELADKMQSFLTNSWIQQVASQHFKQAHLLVSEDLIAVKAHFYDDVYKKRWQPEDGGALEEQCAQRLKQEYGKLIESRIKQHQRDSDNKHVKKIAGNNAAPTGNRVDRKYGNPGGYSRDR